MVTTQAVLQVRSAVEGHPSRWVFESVEALLRRYRPLVRALCVRITDVSRAEALADDVLRALLSDLAHLGDAGEGRSRARILAAARRHAVEAVRLPGDLLVQDAVVTLDSAVGERLLTLSWRERCRAVDRALAGVDPWLLQAAARLRYVDNLPSSAIAGWLRTPEAPRALTRHRGQLRRAIGRVLADQLRL